MEIKLYNSLTKKKEVFIAAIPKKVNIYVCGVTVYDYCHLGHARGAINFDILRKFFRVVGYEVIFIKNYTDIDDKIIEQAKIKGVSTKELTEKMIVEHDKDMASLFVEPPDIAPKATDNIEAMIAMIAELIQKGFAYESGGDVFFRIKNFQEYGKLSGKKVEDLQAGARVEINQNKENPLDFVLWKASKPGEPSWSSAWGAGRPGWHIECSCMCKKFIDGKLDIHCGGSDLIFPHHENEIAQSESLSQEKMANYWMHNGMIEIDGKKMSKSLGNFTKIRDLVIQENSNIYQGYDPRVIRFFILQSHYKQNLLFSDQALQGAYRALSNIYIAMVMLEEKLREKKLPPLPVDKKIEDFRINIDAFLKCLANDLNSPEALARIFEWKDALVAALAQGEIRDAEKLGGKILLAMKILGLIDEKKPFSEWHKTRKAPFFKENIESILQFVEDVSSVDPDTNMIKKALQETLADPTPEQLRIAFNLLMSKRDEFRISKDWEHADHIRKLLLELGIKVIDRPIGSIWRYT